MAYTPVTERTGTESAGYTPVASRVAPSAPPKPGSLGYLAPRNDLRTAQSTSPVPTGPDTLDVAGALAKGFGQGIGRSYLAAGQFISTKIANPTMPLNEAAQVPLVQQPDTTFLGQLTRHLSGTDEPISIAKEDIQFPFGLGQKTGGALTLGTVGLDLVGGGGLKGLKGLTTALKDIQDVGETSRLLRGAGFAEDIIKQYAPIFAAEKNANKIEEGLIAAEKLQNGTKIAAYTPIAERTAQVTKMDSLFAEEALAREAHIADLEKALDEYNKTPGLGAEMPTTPYQFNQLDQSVKDYLLSSGLVPERLGQQVVMGMGEGDLRSLLTKNADLLESIRSGGKIVYNAGDQEMRFLREEMGPYAFSRYFRRAKPYEKGITRDELASNIGNFSDSGVGGDVQAFVDEVVTYERKRAELSAAFKTQRALEKAQKANDLVKERMLRADMKNLQKKVEALPTQRTTTGAATARVIKQSVAGPEAKMITKSEKTLLRDRIRAEARGAKFASKDIRAEIRRRRNLMSAIRKQFGFTDGEMASLLKGRDFRFMNEETFRKFLQAVEDRANELDFLSSKRAIINGAIAEKGLLKVDNLRKAMQLPPIQRMNISELTKFDQALEQFKQGDEFLGVRQLETVKNTNLDGIHTLREAREALAKETGVPVESLDNIKVSELDRYRYDTALARKNPFYDLMVLEKNKAMLNAEAGFYEIKTEINTLINAARKSRKQGVLDRLIPTDKRIFDWLEADDAGKMKLGKDMTEEELKAGAYIQKIYADARDYLVQHEVLKKYISDYITHIRRGFLETWREDGLITAFKETFNQYKQDEAVFDILNQRTGDVLPLEKFFQFSMRRTGELEPTKNVAKAVQAYFRAFEKKKALDSLVPKLDIYAHSLTPKKLTPKGLEYDTSLKRFVKEWVNSKKGRVADTTIVKPGGKIDWVLRTGVALTRILDLGLSVPIGLASNFGEQIGTFRMLGTKPYIQGVLRLGTKQGRAITDRYMNFVGEPLMDRLRDASAGLGDQLGTAMFSLFGASTRRANQIFLLANMTKDEFAKGVISTERLARLQTLMGRSRVVENFESVIGKTSIGKAATQYKAWAVPILSSTLDDIGKVSKMLAKGDLSVTHTVEFKELMRTVVLSGAVGFGLYGFMQAESNNKNRTFIEDLAFKAARDSLSLIGALDPTFWSSSPRLLSFLNDLSTAIKQIVLIEKTKDGELKAPKTVGRALVPKAITQFTKGEPAPSQKPTKAFKAPAGLPELPTLKKVLPTPPGLPKLPTP